MFHNDEGRITLWIARALSRLGNEVDAAVRRAAESKYGDDQHLTEEVLEPWLKMQYDPESHLYQNAALGWTEGNCCEPDSIAYCTKNKITFEDLDRQGQFASLLYERVYFLKRMCEYSLPNTKLLEKQIFENTDEDFVEMIKNLSGLCTSPNGN